MNRTTGAFVRTDRRGAVREFAAMRRRGAVFSLFAVLAWAVLRAEAPEFSDMRWRLLGPFRGGWATVARGVPGDPATFYFGSADGGVWRTRDAGLTWQPLFNDQSSASIGALAIAPSDPKVIWVGTGQKQLRWDVVDGDGVYRSVDGGAHWSHVGLEATRHIGGLWVDPRNADVAIVASLGHVFGPNPERGLYRTTDGGKHWAHVLDRGPDVGAADIAGDPGEPDVLYASLWEVRRRPWLDYYRPAVGPGSGIVRSTDGGATWRSAGTKGFPEGPLGRIDLAVSPGSRGKRVYATIAKERGGGLYRSDDGGESWLLVNPEGDLASSYTSGITPDPSDPDVLYVMGRSIRITRDGGKTVRVAKGSPGGDDYHDLWIDPSNPRRMISASDQGASVTGNGGATWSSWYNQPTGQFYRLGVDDRFPYRVYSGQQDSGSVAILSRSDYGQLTFRDWHPVGADERDADLPDPVDPGVVYGAGLGGRLSRWNARTGEVQNVSPVPYSPYGARPRPGIDRFAWITPLAISPRPPHAIYLGSQFLYRSLDSGARWDRVSADLTGADPAARGCEGDVTVDHATACGFGVIFTIAPSPATDGVVWVGTDNGRVLVTRDDTRTWSDVSPPGIGDWTKVNTIDASPAEPGTAYVAADRHRLDDFRPMAYRTHDFGAHWTDIARGLPGGCWVGVVRVDPKRAGLLYAGTNRGVWVSFDDGDHWRSLQENLPTTGINDLRVHGDDLLVATQGRALWVLDQIAPLRAQGTENADTPTLIPPSVAYRLRANQSKDTPLPAEEPRGENPPPGAVLDYVLPQGFTGEVALTILDASGRSVRRFSTEDPKPKSDKAPYFGEPFLGEEPRLSRAPGHHRFVWNLRLDRPEALGERYSIAGIPGRPTPVEPEGPLVLPGRYRVRLTAGSAVSEQSLDVVLDPRSNATPDTLARLLAVQRAAIDALARSARLERERSAADAAIGKSGSGPTRKSLESLGWSHDESPAHANALLAELETDLENTDAEPTGPQIATLARLERDVSLYESRWNAFLAGPYASIARRRDRPFRADFSVPRERLATAGRNPYFVLEPGYRLIFAHGRATLTVTVLDEEQLVDGIKTRVVEEREESGGRLVEVSRNYVAIDTAGGDVYTFGEDSRSRSKSGAESREGSWLAGEHGAKYGLMVPGAIRVGDRFYQEQAPGVAMDRAEIASTGETVKAPAGTFENCVTVEETSPLETGRSRKAYAPGVGLVRNDEFLLVAIERDGVEQVWVPSGSFTMGSDEASIAAVRAAHPPKWVERELASEQPAHRVTLTHGFWIDKNEVTNAAFQRFVESGGYATRAFWSDAGWAWREKQDVTKLPLPCVGTEPDRPRRCVTWYEAEAFAAYRGGRLPTEAEWEYAARGPRSSVYPWGSAFDPSQCNVVGTDGPVAVGRYPRGASWVGALDMAGNAMEWVTDWLDVGYYSRSPELDPTGPSTGTIKVEKGGWWGSNPFVARSAYRHFEDSPDYGDKHIGFRVVVP
jgi:formylglycine-generating enzyme required for sulfatase activity/photosystem II stability/assembly factor-like uncharacterized protein